MGCLSSVRKISRMPENERTIQNLLKLDKLTQLKEFPYLNKKHRTFSNLFLLDKSIRSKAFQYIPEHQRILVNLIKLLHEHSQEEKQEAFQFLKESEKSLILHEHEYIKNLYTDDFCDDYDLYTFYPKSMLTFDNIIKLNDMRSINLLFQGMPESERTLENILKFPEISLLMCGCLSENEKTFDTLLYLLDKYNYRSCHYKIQNFEGFFKNITLSQYLKLPEEYYYKEFFPVAFKYFPENERTVENIDKYQGELYGDVSNCFFIVCYPYLKDSEKTYENTLKKNDMISQQMREILSDSSYEYINLEKEEEIKEEENEEEEYYKPDESYYRLDCSLDKYILPPDDIFLNSFSMEKISMGQLLELAENFQAFCFKFVNDNERTIDNLLKIKLFPELGFKYLQQSDKTLENMIKLPLKVSCTTIYYRKELENEIDWSKISFEKIMTLPSDMIVMGFKGQPIEKRTMNNILLLKNHVQPFCFKFLPDSQRTISNLKKTYSDYWGKGVIYLNDYDRTNEKILELFDGLGDYSSISIHSEAFKDLTYNEVKKIYYRFQKNALEKLKKSENTFENLINYNEIKYIGNRSDDRDIDLPFYSLHLTDETEFSLENLEMIYKNDKDDIRKEIIFQYLKKEEKTIENAFKYNIQHVDFSMSITIEKLLKLPKEMQGFAFKFLFDKNGTNLLKIDKKFHEENIKYVISPDLETLLKFNENVQIKGFNYVFNNYTIIDHLVKMDKKLQLKIFKNAQEYNYSIKDILRLPEEDRIEAFNFFVMKFPDRTEEEEAKEIIENIIHSINDVLKLKLDYQNIGFEYLQWNERNFENLLKLNKYSQCNSFCLIQEEERTMDNLLKLHTFLREDAFKYLKESDRTYDNLIKFPESIYFDNFQYILYQNQDNFDNILNLSKSDKKILEKFLNDFKDEYKNDFTYKNFIKLDKENQKKYCLNFNFSQTDLKNLDDEIINELNDSDYDYAKKELSENESMNDIYNTEKKYQNLFYFLPEDIANLNLNDFKKLCPDFQVDTIELLSAEEQNELRKDFSKLDKIVQGKLFQLLPDEEKTIDNLLKIDKTYQDFYFEYLIEKDKNITNLLKIDKEYQANAFKDLKEEDRNITNLLKLDKKAQGQAFQYLNKKNKIFVNILSLDKSAQAQAFNFLKYKEDYTRYYDFLRLDEDVQIQYLELNKEFYPGSMGNCGSYQTKLKIINTHPKYFSLRNFPEYHMEDLIKLKKLNVLEVIKLKPYYQAIGFKYLDPLYRKFEYLKDLDESIQGEAFQYLVDSEKTFENVKKLSEKQEKIAIKYLKK